MKALLVGLGILAAANIGTAVLSLPSPAPKPIECPNGTAQMELTTEDGSVSLLLCGIPRQGVTLGNPDPRVYIWQVVNISRRLKAKTETDL